MTASSSTPPERARKITSTVLQATQRDATQVAIAAAMGVSESTVSRLLSDHLDKLALVLAHAGLKVVPTDHVCVNRESYQALSHIASKAMANREIARQLIWEGE